MRVWLQYHCQSSTAMCYHSSRGLNSKVATGSLATLLFKFVGDSIRNFFELFPFTNILHLERQYDVIYYPIWILEPIIWDFKQRPCNKMEIDSPKRSFSLEKEGIQIETFWNAFFLQKVYLWLKKTFVPFFCIILFIDYLWLVKFYQRSSAAIFSKNWGPY